VNVKNSLARLDTFFLVPISTKPIALFRILYGLCVSATLLLLHTDWNEWFGVHSWISASTMSTFEPEARLNLFRIIPNNDRWIDGFFWFALLSSVLLIAGLGTRLMSIVVFLCVTSIYQREPFITHGGDSFLRVAGFFLIFAPAGLSFSLDSAIRRWSGRPWESSPRRSPWAQRMIQFELAILYFVSFCWKIQGHSWWNGTALYYVTHLRELQRFPIPHSLLAPWILRLGGWFTLALEFSLGVLIWFRPFRYPLLMLGLIFHLTLEYALNIPMFQWDILAAYILFVDPDDWRHQRCRCDR
jgi:hypothetical protein